MPGLELGRPHLFLTIPNGKETHQKNESEEQRSETLNMRIKDAKKMV